MKENDKLTYMQQVALEGEVAFALSSAIHNADLKMRIYIILKELKEDYRGYVIQAVKNIVQLPEEELERVILEVSQPEMPLWLWVDRCIADIKLAVFHSELTNTPETKLAINKKKVKTDVVVSAFNKFVREILIRCSQAARELLIRVREDNELDFLHPSCVFCLEELRSFEEKHPPKAKIPFSLIEVGFNVKNILSFLMETDALEHFNKSSEKVANKAKNLMEKAQKEDKQGFIEALDEVISSVIGETIENLATQEAEEKEEKPIKKVGARYVVMKRFTGSNFQVPLRDFKTRSEALVYVNELIENFPELKKTCTFDIVRKEGK